jgi:nucleoside-diphosphate-sugar epimerase
VSSLSVYAVPADGATVSEDSPYDDGAGERGFYARSKLAADQVASAAMQAGAPVTIVRPGLLYGPGRKPPLARRVAAVGPLRVLLASPDYRLPLAYVDNVADAIVLAARTPAAVGRSYTIVDVHARQADYARLYRQQSGGRWLAVHAPLGVLRAAASAAERVAALLGRRSPITRHQVERTLRSASFATGRAHDELGWQPRVPLEEALRRSFAGRQPAVRGESGSAVHSPA